MKKVVRGVLMLIMWLFNKVYSYDLNRQLHSYFDTLYTLWIRNSLGDLGRCSSISKPCSLQGGGSKNIVIGHHTSIQSHVILGCWVKYGEMQTFTPTLKIGNYCSIGEYNHITVCNKITIGDGVLTGRYVYIGDNAHGGLSWEEATIPPANRMLRSKGEVRIGNNVWIGDKVTILGGVSIGDNVIVGANSVVTQNVPSNCIVAGVPAKVVRCLNK